MSKYYRITQGVKDPGELVEEVNIDYSKNDYYKSVYYYNQKQYEQFKLTGTVSGITDVKTNQLIFDFDGKNLDNSKADTIELIERLKKQGFRDSSFEITFSGNKGFGVRIKINEEINPQQHKDIAKKLCEGLDTWDSKVYNASRILRVMNTKHPVSGYYKIPLTYEELQESDIDMIKVKAIAPRNQELEYSVESIEGINVEAPKTPEMNVENKTGLDLSKKPPGLSNWKYALTMGYFPPGSRNHALMILAATYKNLNYPKNMVYRMLKSAVELQSERHQQEPFDKNEIWNNIVKPVFDPTWIGGTYAEKNFPDEIKKYLINHGIFSEKDEIGQTVQIQDSLSDFTKYAENIDNNTMRFGIKSLDEKVRFQTGHLVGMLAGPGLGKSSFALTVLNNTSKEGLKSIFFSYDMYSAIVMQKLIQRETGLGSEEIFEIYKNRKTSEIKKLREIVEKNYNNVTFCFKSGQTLEGIIKTIKNVENKLGEPVKFICVDYSELVIGSVSDPTQRSMEVIQGLRTIANEMEKCVLVLLQPNKASSNPTEPLTSYNSAKGSSSIAQAVTTMITAHRPGYNNPELDNFFSINCVKNRMGPLFSLDFHWEGRTGKIRDLDEIEAQQLKELRDMKHREREMEDL